MTLRLLSATFATLLVAACASPTIKEPSSGHLLAESAPPAKASIPQPITQALDAPKPKARPQTETYSVVVNNVKVHDLLFALARDAKVNVDIFAGINGYVTLNAIDQTLPQILERIAKQVDMRFEMDGQNLTVMPDTPFLRSYQVNYVNMSREVSSTLSTNTQIAAGGIPGATGATQGGNASRIQIKNDSKNHFWDSLEKNIRGILQDTDKERILSRRAVEATEATARQSVAGTASGSSASAAGANSSGNTGTNTSSSAPPQQNSGSAQGLRQGDFKDYETIFAATVMVNQETGVISVRGTSRQHQKVQEFISKVTANARRQVMIEATVVEVTLADGYQQGIDWTKVGGGFSLTPPTLPKSATSSVTPFVLKYSNPLGIINLNLLEAYGTTKVLSSPKLSVMNNQTATLKVSTDIVYFNVKGDTTAVGNNAAAIATYTTTPQTVSVGFFMSITPQISDSGTITLSVRPSLSSVEKFVPDPNPALQKDGIRNDVPQIRTREMESMLRLEAGEIGVLGGLMEDSVGNQVGRIPGVGAIPLFGEIFNNRNNIAAKTELVIFIRPTVVNDPSVNGDFSSLRDQLPNSSFFDTPAVFQPFGINRRDSRTELQ
ncbi:MAG: type II and III secretion system protein [Zoogloeaceae bacterium]|nr:type II and III secretion system protein [Zoogloeaceae bacterium]